MSYREGHINTTLIHAFSPKVYQDHDSRTKLHWTFSTFTSTGTGWYSTGYISLCSQLTITYMWGPPSFLQYQRQGAENYPKIRRTSTKFSKTAPKLNLANFGIFYWSYTYLLYFLPEMGINHDCLWVECHLYRSDDLFGIF